MAYWQAPLSWSLLWLVTTWPIIFIVHGLAVSHWKHIYASIAFIQEKEETEKKNKYKVGIHQYRNILQWSQKNMKT